MPLDNPFIHFNFPLYVLKRKSVPLVQNSTHGEHFGVNLSFERYGGLFGGWHRGRQSGVHGRTGLHGERRGGRVAALCEQMSMRDKHVFPPRQDTLTY